MTLKRTPPNAVPASSPQNILRDLLKEVTREPDDTHALVSGYLTNHGDPGQLVDAVMQGIQDEELQERAVQSVLKELPEAQRQNLINASVIKAIQRYEILSQQPLQDMAFRRFIKPGDQIDSPVWKAVKTSSYSKKLGPFLLELSDPARQDDPPETPAAEESPDINSHPEGDTDGRCYYHDIPRGRIKHPPNDDPRTEYYGT